MDEKVIKAAAGAHGITGLRPLRAGGQKYVAAADRGSEPVVLKVVALGGGPSAGVARTRAHREVDLLRKVSSRHVVRVVSGVVELGGEPPDAVTWLEEYLDGDDLSDRLYMPWDWVDVARLGLHVARGLGAMHDLRVAHRDLSPNNVRCLADGTFKVMDPGLARHIGQTTLTGVFQPGTIGWLSPEHVTAQPHEASDVFCVGLLMYAALTGQQAIPVGADPQQYARELANANVPPVRQARPDLAPDQAAIVDRCLQRASARRYLDGNELATALDAL